MDIFTDARILTSFIEDDYSNRCTYETIIFGFVYVCTLMMRSLEQDTLD